MPCTNCAAFMNNLILDKLKCGDHKAFSEIYEVWHKKVYLYFKKLTADEYTAKELTQQTFIKLWRYRAKVAPNLSADQQLFQKARQVYIDWLRKEATYRKHFISDELQELPAIAASGEMYDLQKALNNLPPRRKKVFELKHIYGYSYKEIAEYLNISVKTVDNHLLKATAQLRKAVDINSSIGIILIITA